jgi:hypothetical protein
MTHSDFKNLIVNTLGKNIIVGDGATLYSSFKTLKKGDIYILGLNPGGSDEGLTIEKSLKNIRNEDYNEYLAEWNRPAGQHPLQKNIHKLVKLFDQDVKSICASNLIFERSKNADAIKGIYRDSEKMGKYWKIHKQIIEIVQPKIIIAFGNGVEISPYQFVKEKISDCNDEKAIYAGHGNYQCRSVSVNIEGRNITLIGLPHLSRYHLYTDNPKKKKVLEWIKEISLKNSSQ